jgi:hypothetical protein
MLTYIRHATGFILTAVANFSHNNKGQRVQLHFNSASMRQVEPYTFEQPLNDIYHKKCCGEFYCLT